MSAIVAAMRMTWLRAGFAMVAGDYEQSELLSATVNVACNTLNAASNAACRAMVVEGAPRTWAVRWLYSAWRGWFAVADRSCVGACVGFAPDRDQRLRPTWDAGSRLWVWGSAAHDPRPCAWPRPFARGADR